MKHLLTLSVLALSSSASAATHYAGPWGHPTIQAAIDAAAPGDTVNIYPQAWGERPRITKSITLQKLPNIDGTASLWGVDLSELRTANATVKLANVTLYAPNGPALVRGPTSVVAPYAPNVILDHVIGNGTYITAAAVTGLINLQVRTATLFNGPAGISIFGGADLEDLVVRDVRGAGIAIGSTIYQPSYWQNRIVRTSTYRTGGHGIYLANDNGDDYVFSNVRVETATEVGIFLHGADGTKIMDTVVRFTREKNDVFGDGIHVRDAVGVDLIRVTTRDNARAGLSAFGISSPAYVTSMDGLFVNNGFHLNTEHDGELEDVGGNDCFTNATREVCVTVSSELEPPSPPAP